MSIPVLVIGGAGYIGSHVCLALAERGLLPVVYDNLSTGRRDFVQWGPLVVGDAGDALALCAAARRYGVKAAIHLAASIEVGESVANPLKYYTNNVANVVAAAGALAESGLRALVFSSTAAIYGEPVQCPIPETHPANPLNPYGAGKAMAERIFADTAAAGGVPCVPLRYFNACGADPKGRIGEAHDPESHLIPRACLAALGRIEPLCLFGDDFDTPDGTPLRDYVHVDDLAQAHLRALDYLLAGGVPRPFNLGLGRGISVREVIAAVETVSGLKVPHRLGPRRAGDGARLIADASDARAFLGWVPRYDAIEDIAATAWAWHAASPHRGTGVRESRT